jgi:hypothetical protein
MTDLIGWLTSVLAIDLTIGTVTLSLGALVIGAIVIRFGIGVVKGFLGRR